MIKLIFSRPKWLAGLITLVLAGLLIGGCTSANQQPLIPSLNGSHEEANQPPLIASLFAIQERVNPSGSCQVQCFASDPDGDKLSYTWSAGNGVISGEGSTVSWTAPEAPGAYTITVQVTDGRDGEATAQLIVNVAAPNHPPTIENLVVTAEHRYLKETTAGYTTTESAYKVLQGKAYEIECVASDPDGDELLSEWSADGGAISGEGAVVVTWTAPLRGGEVTVTVTVSDGRGGVATKSVVFVVMTCAPCAFG
jgi:hypothetical protein